MGILDALSTHRLKWKSTISIHFVILGADFFFSKDVTLLISIGQTSFSFFLKSLVHIQYLFTAPIAHFNYWLDDPKDDTLKTVKFLIILLNFLSSQQTTPRILHTAILERFVGISCWSFNGAVTAFCTDVCTICIMDEWGFVY